MFPENPFLQLTLPRVSRALGDIQALIWTEIAPISCQFGGAQAAPLPWEAARKLAYKSVQLPFHWGRIFDQGWFRLEIPKVAADGPLYLHWDDQGEGTVYVDGDPFYGFDVAHRYCALPAKVREVHVESLCLQSAIWHPAAKGIDEAGSRLGKAALFTRNDLAWEVWHDLRVLHDLALEEYKVNFPTNPPKLAGGSGIGYQHPVDIVTPLYRRLLREMDDAVNALDEGGLPGIRKSLKQSYKKFEGQAERIRAVLTGHAHIDLVWLWPERTSEYKATHTFSTMNRLMDIYPEFIFGYSQPASYDAVKRISPKLMDKVQKRIAAGRWEALGATEVESDTLMACGEALARSFILGQEGFRRLQGKPSRVLWIPDVFGYCGSLPQIMRQTGVDYFFTTKLTWSNINLFPHSSFVWRGIDGSEVLVHVTQENGYNQTATPEEIRRGARAYRQSDVHDEYLAPTGWGDGGGGVTEEMCERARRAQSLAGMPEVGWGRVDAFFDKLNEVREKLPSWQGELYLEFHRGVLTTHSDLKSRFRECERALQIWEAARCATGGGEIDREAWRRLVFAQFHDYIPGSSIWEVYEEGLPELAAISAKALASAAKELGKGKSSALFNSLPVERVHLVENNTKAVRIAPLSGTPLEELAAVLPVKPVQASAKNIASDSVKATFDAKGRIASLTFAGKEIAAHGPLAGLMLFPDHPHGFEAWDIDRQTLSLGREVATPAEVSVLQEGGLQGMVEFRRKLSAKSTAAIRYRLDAFQPVLHLEFEIDWHEERSLLKVIFPTAYTGRLARFGAPFGSVQRGQQAGPARDEAMFEGAASRWAIVGDDGDNEGLGVVTEAKYGFSCRDGELSVSLLRSARVTGEEPAPGGVVPKSLRRGGERSTYSDQGRHLIRLALCFHSPQTPREALAPTLADVLYTSPLPYQGAAVNAGFLGLDGLESVIPSWAKPAADGRGWILRLHETMGRRGKVSVRLDKGLKAFKTDLSERTTDAQPLREISVSPYELISLRIR
jgi:alpha-mannosidase